MCQYLVLQFFLFVQKYEIMPYKCSLVTDSFTYQCAMVIFQYQSLFVTVTVAMSHGLFNQFPLVEHLLLLVFNL